MSNDENKENDETSHLMGMAEFLDQDDYAMLDCNQIDPNPDQDRQDWESAYALEQYEALKNSIDKDGKVKRPIEVIKKDNGRYMIIAGERRWRISKNLHFKTIPAVIRNDITPEQASIDMLTENENHSPLSPIERALAYEKRLTMFDFSVNDLAEKTGIPKRRIYESLNLLKLGEELIEVVKKTFTRDSKMLLDLGKLQESNQEAYDQGLEMLKNNKLTRKKLQDLTAGKSPPNTKSAEEKRSNGVPDTVTIPVSVAHCLYVKARRLTSYECDPFSEEFYEAFLRYVKKLVKQ